MSSHRPATVGKRLSPNFLETEFSCNHCGNVLDISQTLIDVLQDVRNHFNAGVIVNSGYRCPTHNRNVGGSANSQHLRGTAADIRVSNVSPATVHRYLADKYAGRFGLGRYNTFTHVDVRTGGAARWG